MSSLPPIVLRSRLDGRLRARWWLRPCSHASTRGSSRVTRALPYDWCSSPQERGRDRARGDHAVSDLNSTSTRSCRRQGLLTPPSFVERALSRTRARMRARPETPRPSGPRRQSGWTGTDGGTPSWSGPPPFVKWFVGGSRMPRRTAWTDMSRRAAATRSRTTGRGSPGIRERSPTAICSTRSLVWPTGSVRSGCGRAIG